jgi:hypothetical protein
VSTSGSFPVYIATGHSGDTYTYSDTNSALNTYGLTLTSSGEILGTPTSVTTEPTIIYVLVTCVEDNTKTQIGTFLLNISQ